jgi:4-hydroxybenzoate polyprenyltransferase
VLDQQRRDKWPAPERAWPIQPAMTFAPDGLVLGAATVLLLNPRSWLLFLFVELIVNLGAERLPVLKRFVAKLGVLLEDS